MTVTVTSIDTGERWNDLLDRSPNRTVFHRNDFLEVAAEHSGMRLHRLIGHKGEEPIGLLPLFERRIGPFTAVFSPPPSLGLYQLGPVLLNFRKLKSRKRERRNRRFVEECMSWLDEEVGPNTLHLRTHDRYDDLRPFEWRDCDVTPRYTYTLDIDCEADDVLMAFSRNRRRNVRDGLPDGCRIEEEGPDAIRRIVRHVDERYREQGEHYPIDPEYVVDLYEQLPEGAVRPYVLRREGEYVGGLVTLEDDDAVYRWQGGVTPEADLPANDHLDWRVITDAMARDKSRYDLAGANTPRISEYKAKFGPELSTFHLVERTDRLAAVAKGVYGSTGTLRQSAMLFTP